MLYLNSIAAHEKIVLSEDRKQSIKAKANRLYASLSDDEKAYVTGDEESLYRILVKYELAYETEKKLLEGQKIEIADEATRVADI